MSRIGKEIINIPLDVKVNFDSNVVRVQGQYGELFQKLTEGITCVLIKNQLTINRPSNSKKHLALHGLYRSLINNMITGVSERFVLKLELVGIGYRVFSQKQNLEIFLGFSHSIFIELPEEILVETLTEKGKNPLIILRSIDKQLLGMVASKIRSFRKPEPYKGKGVKFFGEVIRKKAGKSVK